MMQAKATMMPTITKFSDSRFLSSTDLAAPDALTAALSMSCM
ncbi:hypothetical protein GA0115255_104984 [Streptomyces sp. Ncost-T6T-2b]|nr:hypothetical protein GA0115255_104984 [Streptomyces sp. Ncost-T6T-2b]